MALETQNGVMPVSNNKPPPTTTTTTTIQSDIQQQNHQNLQQPQDQRPDQIIIEPDQQMEQQAAVINGSKSHEKSVTKQPKQTDANISFLRAARSGDLEKVIEFLESGQVTDINTCNANGLNALHLAAKDGYVDIVSELLKRGANVDNATKKGNTALHIASLAGQKEVIKLLIQYNANVNVQSLNGFTPLYMAAQENHDACVRYLLAKGANPSLATEDGFTPLAVAMQQEHDKVVAVLLESDSRGKVRLPALHIAAKKDDVKAATLLLENEHNPDIVSKSGFTPLHIAAHYGNVDIANLLVEKGADVNFTAKHNITPLHVACKWGKTNMLLLLLSKGAKIDSTTRDGLTPLHCAARSGHEKVIEILLKNNAPILSKTKNGLAPLHMAAQGEHDEAARILLQHKAPVDEVTVDYLTALHVAAHCGHVKVAKLLLDHNADPNARALNGFTPLHIACKKNRIKVVELLLKHNASISATTESGLTPLHVASFMGCMNIVIYLLQHDANPDAPTIRGETPLHLAARANQTDIIRILLRNGSLVDVKAREGQTPLHVASRLGNIDIVMLLLQHGANVDSATKDLYTPLHIASKEGQEDVAAVLIENQASLDATTKKGFSPLHLAAKYGNVPIAQLLLQKGAAVDAQGKNGVTPLHVASHYDHQNVALLLLEKGASPHTSAKNGHTALHIAAKKNQMDIATHLLQYGAKANAESKSGFTPLHLAAQEGHADMVNLLLEHGADPNQAAKNGLTAMHLCAQEDKTEVAKILLERQATIDERTKAGYTPLHVAAHFGQVSMVKFLLENDAKIELTTNVGYTPLHQAAQQGHTLIINLLLKHKANPNALTNNGQTALSIANKLGYVTAVETLKIVTETSITSTVTGVLEEKYKVIAPESMHETFMSDSEDECGEDHIDQHQYKYMATDDLKTGGDTTKFDTTDDGDRRCLVPIQESVVPSHYINQESTSPYIIKSVDNVNIVRQPIHVGGCDILNALEPYLECFGGRKYTPPMCRESFLVSFLVDARGGAMRGCRHSGVRVIVPPKSAAQPTRITCRYVKPQRIPNPPPLMEGEALVSRILELSPVEAKFLGPVILEVPHFGSLRDKEREIIILRSDNGETWREHTLYDSEEAVRGVLNESFDTTELNQLEDLHTNRIIRVVTHDFPHYFAIVSRIRQEVHAIGPDGGTVSSTAVPQVQAIFPANALTKKIRVGLQAQPVDLNGCAKLLGQGVAVSPVVTVEPRRRKFHKAITLSMPAPRAHTQGMINQYSGSAPTLRLLCSITGGQNRAIWEDVTGSTPLTFVKDSVSFTTTVSARFWLMDCRNISDASRMATELYSYMAQVPFMVKFVVFAKRVSATEAKLSVFCMTDDKEDKTLEQQEYFTEIAKSRDVEVLEDQKIYLEFAGNLIPVMKSGEQLNMQLHAFRENRLSFTVRVKDTEEPFGRISFMNEPKVAKGDAPLIPICTLNVSLAGEKIIEDDRQSLNTSQKSLDRTYRVLLNGGYRKPDEIHKADIRLSDICNLLENDWVNLANELDVPETDIELIKSEYPDKPSQQAMIMLRLWLRQAGPQATGNNLEQALHKIKRSDIVDKCIFNLELVTDEMEKAVAKMQLDQSGFDNLKEELGPSRDTSLRRNQTIDQNYADKLDDSADEKKDEMAEFNGKDAIERRGEKDLNSTLMAGEKEFDRSLTPSPIPIEHGSKFDDKIPPTAKPEITDLSHHEDNKMKGRTPDEKRKIIIRVPDEEIVPDDAETLARQILDDLEMAAANELRLHDYKDQSKTQDQDGVDSDVDDKIMAALPTNKVKTIKKHSKVNSIITQQQPTRPTVGDIEWDLSVTSTPEKADSSPEKASEKKVIEISTANLENVLPTETTQSEEVIEIIQSSEPVVTSPKKQSNRTMVEDGSTQLITPSHVQESKLEQILPTGEKTASGNQNVTQLITPLSVQESKLEQILPTTVVNASGNQHVTQLITPSSVQERKLEQILPTTEVTVSGNQNVTQLITPLGVQERKLEQILPTTEVTVSGNQHVTQLITPSSVQERKLEQILPTTEVTVSGNQHVTQLITPSSVQERKLEQILPTTEVTVSGNQNVTQLITPSSVQERKLEQILPASGATLSENQNVTQLITPSSVQERKLEQILPTSEVTVSGNRIVTNTTTTVNPDGSETTTVTTEEFSPSGDAISKAVKCTTSPSHVDSNIEIDTDLINTIRETLTNYDSVNSINDLQQRSQQQHFSESDGSTACDSTGDQQQNKMHVVQTKTRQVRKNQGSSSDSDIALHEPGAELSEDETEADFYQGSEQPITLTETTVDELSYSDNGNKIIKTTTTTTTTEAVVTSEQQPIELSENQKLFDSELAARSARVAELDDGLPTYESAVIQQNNESDDHELRESMQKITNQFMCEERKHC